MRVILPGFHRAALVIATLMLGACGESSHPSSSGQLAATGTVTAPVDVGTDTFTTTVINLRVKVGPNNDTLCNVVANLHHPASATASHPAPALMATNGFGGSKDDGDATGTNNALMQFAKHGYVGLSYSGLGFGGSDCLISLDDPAWDGKAASQLAQFLGGADGIGFATYSYSNGQQVWSDPLPRVDYVIRDDTRSGLANDPRVGMIGASYGGAVTYAAAAADRRIDTIVPQETWTKLSYSLAPNNANPGDQLEPPTVGVTKKGWLALFSAAGFTQPAQYPNSYRPSSTCPGFISEACTAIANLSALGYPDSSALDISQRTSVLDFADDINIPVMISQGVSDSLFNLHEGIAFYQRLKARNIPVKLQWMSWGHGGGNCLQPFPPGPPCAGIPAQGELDVTQPLEDSYQGRVYLAWFDHWLKDVPNNTGAEFSYYRDWIAPPVAGQDNTQYADAPAGYPVGTPTAFYLSGSGDLVTAASAVTAGSAQFVTSTDNATSYSESSAVDRSAPTFDLPGTFASFTSAALTTDLDVVGQPVLSVQLQAPTFAATQASGPSGQLVLFAKIYDVAADGTKTLPYRLVSPMRISDVGQPLTISLPLLAHRFAAGHQVQLVLAQGDSTYAGNTLVGPVTITNSASQPYTLQLPVVR